MTRYRHPLAAEDAPGYPPARVHVSRAEKVPVDDAGEFEAPRGVAAAIADTHDTTVEEMRVEPPTDAAEADLNQQDEADESEPLVNDEPKDGDSAPKLSTETMVEDGICPWCPEDDRYEGDGLPQHASSAHPEEWDAYKEGA